MHFLITAILAAVAVISSPDARLKVHLDAGTYSVTYDGERMLSRSGLGFVTDTAPYTDIELLDVRTAPMHIGYEQDRIKTSRVSREATRGLAEYATVDGHRFGMEWIVSDNDIAFRYLLPKEGETGSVRMLSEDTYFNFPEGTTAYLTPQSDAMIGWKCTKPSYEEYYTLDAPLTVRSQYGHGYTFPCLFKVVDRGWVLVSETGVDSHYCGSRLSDYDGDRGYKLSFPMPEENNGNGTVEPAFALPGALSPSVLSSLSGRI